jgi:hypothetical protein
MKSIGIGLLFLAFFFTCVSGSFEVYGATWMRVTAFALIDALLGIGFILADRGRR